MDAKGLPWVGSRRGGEVRLHALPAQKQTGGNPPNADPASRIWSRDTIPHATRPAPGGQRAEAMPSAVVAVPTFCFRSASPRVLSSRRSSTVWLRSRTPLAVAIGELM